MDGENLPSDVVRGAPNLGYSLDRARATSLGRFSPSISHQQIEHTHATLDAIVGKSQQGQASLFFSIFPT
ncbi:MAG: hypothetical protein AAGL66_13455, partial [Pseudomonadota bacterium]